MQHHGNLATAKPTQPRRQQRRGRVAVEQHQVDPIALAAAAKMESRDPNEQQLTGHMGKSPQKPQPGHGEPDHRKLGATRLGLAIADDRTAMFLGQCFQLADAARGHRGPRMIQPLENRENPHQRRKALDNHAS
jgi:hypothetical protein